ncbi:ABC transporter permease [Clostridium aminobutyricum]|uniref:ABC transporter permease n=1 Tax=Clostridium aminobutyricum TaxID=33953 RepID=A0A939D9Y1_CLOAM|nr:ABC transporter permease [Clostridium aminobutyricum]MBN7773926.1 ABC transporter permease [Clostridium aminobutyricum]
MVGIILKKEIKNYFRSAGNWIFVFGLPLLLILLMSSALEGYMNTDFHTFDEGKVYYYYEEQTEVNAGKLKEFETLLQESTGVVMQEVSDYEEGIQAVNSSEAFGIIKISGDNMSYYRSPYNETNGGKIVHSLFEQCIGKNTSILNDSVHVIELETTPVDSTSYATFTYLAFVILFIALMTGHSVNDERVYGTIQRIKISRVGLNALLFSKVILGLLIGVLQMTVVWAFSTFVLNVNWGSQAPVMFLVLLCLVLMSSIFGVVIGMISKNKAIADNTILMTVMLSGYIGGALSPIYLLENANILNQIVKISPLYWTGRALTNLYVNIVDTNTFVSIGVSLGLTLLFLLIYKLQIKKATLTIS